MPKRRTYTRKELRDKYRYEIARTGNVDYSWYQEREREIQKREREKKKKRRDS